MKKINVLLIFLISIFAFSTNVFAASGNLSVSSGSVYVGDNFTVKVNISSAAAWNVHVSASGPVSGCTINQADATADANDTNKSFSATCTATGEGTITIMLSGDVTSASDGNAVNISGSKSVTVTTKPTPPSNNNNNNNNNKPNNNNNTQDNRSKNNNLKELSVEGYDLIKVDVNNYTLSVTTEVASVNVKATPEDSMAKVSGTGKHDIKVGENNIEVVVTAENGTQNKINIKITRKDGYYLEDLETVLNNDKITDKNIIISSDSILTSQDLEKIKNSKKTVTFNCYDNDKILKYSWVIDGLKLKNTNDLLTTLSSDSENKKDILRLSNYADGLFVNLKQNSNLPERTKLKVFVGSKYEDNDIVSVYAYVKNDDKLELVESEAKVENGFVVFSVVDSSDYFITLSSIENESTSNSNNIFVIIAIIEFILILVVLILDITKTNPIYKIKK